MTLVAERTLVAHARGLRDEESASFSDDEAETTSNLITNYAAAAHALLKSDPVSAHYGLMVALMFSVDIEVRLNRHFQSSKPTTAFRSLRVSAPSSAEKLERIADHRRILKKRIRLCSELVASQVVRLDVGPHSTNRSP
jgi:hypothetical protein